MADFAPSETTAAAPVVAAGALAGEVVVIGEDFRLRSTAVLAPEGSGVTDEPT
jgi:hypothetical protein